MLGILWLSVAAYVVLQVVVIIRSSGLSRLLGALPLLLMVPIVVLTLVGLAQRSNLWPLLLLLASPLALLYVLAFAAFGLPKR
jgi:hypothetical protein